jgi:hypothetical protein
VSAPAAKRGHWWRIVLFCAIGCIAGLAIVAAVIANRFQPVARDYFITTLRNRYHSDVALGDLQISLYPTVHATGENLVLWFHGDHTATPMVKIRRFTLDASFINFFRTPKHIGRLTLEGLELHPPPRNGAPALTSSDQSSAGKKQNQSIPFILDVVEANGARLEITPKDPKKQPLIFDIRELNLNTVGKGQPMTFHALLTNPKPTGLIHADGSFGPWDVDTPVETPLSGRYTFSNADLSDFKGIAGTLSSAGKFAGPLDRIEVHGVADVPNFSLSTGEHPVPLHTDFDATVDGSNGNTDLHPVHARLANSRFDVSGSIERGALESHKTILLNAEAGDNARLEDFLRLAIKGPRSPMTGAIRFRTKVKIPPGETEVIDRLDLDGDFALSGVKFTSADVQNKLAGLSHRAQGDPENHDPDVASEFQGAFRLHNGNLALPNLQFTLPGAHIALQGTYAVRSGTIDLHGDARLDAKVSQMTSGIVSKLLKPIDPLFRRDGAGAVIPFVISGTRGDPSFKLDIGEFIKGIAK